mgnify:CR=1 FL=1
MGADGEGGGFQSSNDLISLQARYMTVPPTLLLVLIAMMVIESDYTFLTRGVFFR